VDDFRVSDMKRRKEDGSSSTKPAFVSRPSAPDRLAGDRPESGFLLPEFLSKTPTRPMKST